MRKKPLIHKVKSNLCNNKGFGVQEILGIAAMFIIAGFVLIPGLKSFAQEVIQELNSWFEKTIISNIFPTL
jgi:ABC-type transport system involved in cytochrome c biogenesis permease subunit